MPRPRAPAGEGAAPRERRQPAIGAGVALSTGGRNEVEDRLVSRAPVGRCGFSGGAAPTGGATGRARTPMVYTAAPAATVATQASPAAAAHRTADGALDGNGRLATPAASAARARETTRARAAAGRTAILARNPAASAPRATAFRPTRSFAAASFERTRRTLAGLAQPRGSRRTHLVAYHQRSCRDRSSACQRTCVLTPVRCVSARSDAPIRDNLGAQKTSSQCRKVGQIGVQRSDKKEQIPDRWTAIWESSSSARGFVVTVGPVSVLLDREAAEELHLPARRCARADGAVGRRHDRFELAS